ncbi:MAG: hypothetical protein WC934_12510, partial [Acidithiobacillus sp.]|uniref:CBM96 family carbohydrate-binding protein n=1 Tax=Acidithiobacillus sp. TaxID=1872118 RepID=UPI00355D9413
YANYSTASGSALSWTDSSPANYNQYKIRAEVTTESTTTLVSSYIESGVIYTIQPPNPPTNLSPNSNAPIDITGVIPITWQHNPIDGSAQTYFSLQFKPFGNATWTLFLNKTARVGSYSNISTAGFVAGVWEYQVRTWGIATTGGGDGTGSSAYSTTGTFVLSTKPVVNITAPTAASGYDSSSLTMTWDYTDTESSSQQMYRAKLYDSSDNVLETKEVSSVVASGGSDSMTFDTKVLNTLTYKIGVQAQESTGLWSDEDTETLLITYAQPPQPSISLTTVESDGAIQIEIDNPVPAVGDPIEVEHTELAIQSVYVDDHSPDTNYLGMPLEAWENNTEDNSVILLDFVLDDYIGATIVSAKIRLTRISACAHPIKSKVQYIEETWDQATATYNTIPTLDATGHNDHVHTSAAEYEDWDITTLMEDIADGTIADYNGFAISVSDYIADADYHYDIFYNIFASETLRPQLIIVTEEETSEIDAEYNNIYRKIDDGEFELILEEVGLNTTITDYTPGINNVNTYYVDAVSITPSITASAEASETLDLPGYYFINGGESYSDFVKLYKNVELTENLNADTVIQAFNGRTYPVKFQSDAKLQIISLSVMIDESEKDEVVSILEYLGNTFYRDWTGRHFQCSFSDISAIKQVKGFQYRISANVTRVEDEVLNLG